MARAWRLSWVLGVAASIAGASNVPVTVSAVNYAEASDAALFAVTHSDPVVEPVRPAENKAKQPLYYLFLPGEVYPSDMTPDAVAYQVEVALEPRGYYNLIYQKKAGHDPHRIDYLLRVHYGYKRWWLPHVRADRITWGNDGLVANRNEAGLQGHYDPREGQNMTVQLRALLPQTAGPGGAARQEMISHYLADFDTHVAVPRYIIVIEAFKFDDVRAHNGKARCAWCTFISTPLTHAQKFSEVAATMLRTAAPYFGSTTSGLQLFEVPPGKVIVGTPVVVPPKP